MKTIIALIVGIMIWQVMVQPSPAQTVVPMATTQVAQGRVYTIESYTFDSIATRRWKTTRFDASIYNSTRYLDYSYHLYTPATNSINDTVKLTILGYQDLKSSTPALADTLSTIYLVGRNSTSLDSVTRVTSLSVATYPYWEFRFQRTANTTQRDVVLQFAMYLSGRKED